MPGFRVGVSPRRRRSSAGDAALGLGCLVLVVGGAAIAALAALLGAVVALFLTPIPYIGLAIVGAAYLTRRIREQRLRKLWLDAVAAAEGMDGARADALDGLWRRGSHEPDIQLLRAALTAHSGRLSEALNALYAAGTKPGRIGALSGAASLWFPGMLEPVWVGGTPATAANLQLVYGHVLCLAGRVDEALPALEPRLHEPHFAAALGSLARAYRQKGLRDRAAALLQINIPKVLDPTEQRQLRYELATLLEESGAEAAAAAELRTVLAHGEYGDASQRLGGIEHRTANSRRLTIAANDERTFDIALTEMRLAKGPRSRANALEEGLARLQQPHMRERLKLEASRIDVEAVLEKAAGLKTRKAKERNLMEALDKVLADDVSDELQRNEIAMLHQALSELEAGR